MTVEDRAAIIVGGAGGIGGAISRRLAAEGYRVTVADRTAQLASETLVTLSGKGHSAVGFDIRDAQQVGAVFDEIEARQPAAVLVVASGGPVADPRTHPKVHTLSTDDWRETIELNLTGVFLVIRKFAQLRVAVPLQDSRIVTIGSSAGHAAQGVIDISYVTSKAALFGLTRQAAFELAGAGLTVNLVAPGVVGTPLFLRTTTPEMREGAVAGALVKRLADPQEVAAAVSYLASRDAGYVTGTTLDINGGEWMN